MWPGMNKQGGVGRIVNITYDDDDDDEGTY